MSALALMTVEDAAAKAQVHPMTIYRALWAGELKGSQRKAPKGPWRIALDDLAAWLRGETPTK